MSTSSCFDYAFNTKTKRIYRYGKAFVYINGKPYYFTQRPHQSVFCAKQKIKDVALSVEEVRRLPWSAVSSKAEVFLGSALKKPVSIRVMFHLMGRDKFVFLTRSTSCYPKRKCD